MNNISRIIAAIDFSDYSAQVLKYAANLADNLKVLLILVNVINQRDINAIELAEQWVSGIKAEDFLKQQKAERSFKLQKLIEEISCSSLPVTTIIRQGTPFRELVQTVKQEKADLVVMGAKGRGNLSNVLFGSTAEKMFRHCPVPLLSVRHMESRIK